ncbi:MAG TPA: DUF262 domain-containing protein [Candidatus Angelobacter sp.]|jgi:hypothetical protein|nr:DUF262 domain-containing protein [Candidatus Angelobacter sp.]
MQQIFSTRNYSIRDFEEWHNKAELELSPKFQRRSVWSDKARSYLMDTIVRGKPIPKLYMRQDVNLKTRRTKREIVDGQQRLRTVLSFVTDGFKGSKAHHELLRGKYFSDLAKDTQHDILKYEFSVDLLQDVPDNEVYDLFARINTYAENLKAQELRNSQYFGQFKSAVYLLSTEFIPFFDKNKIFTPKQILRMAEAEFISELLLAMHEGIRAGGKPIIDNAYKKYDDEFPNRQQHEKRFRETIDSIGGICGEDLSQLEFRATRLFYPLFCAIYHCRFGLPNLGVSRTVIKSADYPKVEMALEKMDGLIETIKTATAEHKDPGVSAEERKMYDALTVHWVHADKRTTLTEYICKQIVKVLKA